MTKAEILTLMIATDAGINAALTTINSGAFDLCGRSYDGKTERIRMFAKDLAGVLDDLSIYASARELLEKELWMIEHQD